MADLSWVVSLGVFSVRLDPCCVIGLASCSRRFLHFWGPFLNRHQGPYFALNFMYPSGLCPTAYAASPVGAGSLLISHLNTPFGSYIRGRLCPFFVFCICEFIYVAPLARCLYPLYEIASGFMCGSLCMLCGIMLSGILSTYGQHSA